MMHVEQESKELKKNGERKIDQEKVTHKIHNYHVRRVRVAKSFRLSVFKSWNFIQSFQSE